MFLSGQEMVLMGAQTFLWNIWNMKRDSTAGGGKHLHPKLRGEAGVCVCVCGIVSSSCSTCSSVNISAVQLYPPSCNSMQSHEQSARCILWPGKQSEDQQEVSKKFLFISWFLGVTFWPLIDLLGPKPAILLASI